MILILNGSIGVGKTSVSWQLNGMLQQSVMLDGDYLGAVSPFEIYDKKRTEYLYQTLAHIAAFHFDNGYQHIIINYVFEHHKELNSLKKKLLLFNQKIYCIRLTCTEIEQRNRILKRGLNQVEWELKRSKELNQILDKAEINGFIGTNINTDNKAAKEVAEYLLTAIKNGEMS